MSTTTSFLPSKHGWPFRNDFGSLPVFGGLYLCGGMCFSALERWREGKPIPAAPRAPGHLDARFREIFLRQMRSFVSRIATEIWAWNRLPDADGPGGKAGIGTRTAAEWAKARIALDAGRPVVLCLIRKSTRLRDHHQVVAYGYNWDQAARRARIAVYDPNHPGRDDVALEIGLADPARGIDARQSTGEGLRGFFVV